MFTPVPVHRQVPLLGCGGWIVGPLPEEKPQMGRCPHHEDEEEGAAIGCPKCRRRRRVYTLEPEGFVEVEERSSVMMGRHHSSHIRLAQAPAPPPPAAPAAPAKEFSQADILIAGGLSFVFGIAVGVFLIGSRSGFTP